jgi:hypothetical protein
MYSPEEVVIEAKDEGTPYPWIVPCSITANIALVASYRFVAQCPSTAVLTAFKTDGRPNPQTHWSVEHRSLRAISKP